MELFIEEIKEEIKDVPDVTVYEDIHAAGTVIPFLCVAPFGVFCIFEEKKNVEGTQKIFQDIRDKFKEPGVSKVYTTLEDDIMSALYLPASTYMFCYDEAEVMFQDEVHGKIHVNDFFFAFLNLFFAALAGQIDRSTRGEHDYSEYINLEEVSEYEIVRHIECVGRSRRAGIDRMVEETTRTKTGAYKGKYRYANGKKYRKTADSLGREAWYPVDEDVDPDAMFKACLFGGFLGVHKFKDGRILMGILYAITCGLFGVFWFFDMFMMLEGKYKLKNKSYMELPEDRKRCLISFLIAIPIYVGLVFLYAKIGSLIYNAAISGVNNAIQNNPNAFWGIENFFNEHIVP